MARKPVRPSLPGVEARGAGGVKRSVRVAERVREALAQALARNLRDPRLADAVITRVEMTDDLQLARVHVRLLAVIDDPEQDRAARKQLLAGLGAATNVLRKRVGESLDLRRLPELRFFYDEGVDASDRVGALLAEIARDEAGKNKE